MMKTAEENRSIALARNLINRGELEQAQRELEKVENYLLQEKV
jgi:hypothetical protein